MPLTLSQRRNPYGNRPGARIELQIIRQRSEVGGDGSEKVLTHSDIRPGLRKYSLVPPPLPYLQRPAITGQLTGFSASGYYRIPLRIY